MQYEAYIKMWERVIRCAKGQIYLGTSEPGILTWLRCNYILLPTFIIFSPLLRFLKQACTNLSGTCFHRQEIQTQLGVFTMLSPWLGPISGALSSTALIVVGLVGIITGSSPTELPHLFVGLLVFGILGFLLSLPLIEKVWRKKSKKEVKQVKTESQIWPPPWARTVGSLCQELGVRPSHGLGRDEANARLRRYGENRIEVLDMPGYLSFFVKEIYEPTQVCTPYLLPSDRRMDQRMPTLSAHFWSSAVKLMACRV